MTFEAEARRIAEAVWGLESGACQPSHYPNDPVVRELDGIVRLRDQTHLLMITTSTRLEKVVGDVKKLGAAEKIESKSGVGVSKWLITEKQLDAQHVEHARKFQVTLITLEQFKQRFFNGRDYLLKREISSFGSARDPLNDSITISDDVYVPLPMNLIEKLTSRDGTRREERHVAVDLGDICSLIKAGSIVVLMAPFGAGKSLTTREIFKKLASEYRSSRNGKVPVCLNLREHWGQDYFDEILDRHARSIGFKPKEDLVIAWRSGVACFLLDGFDELASQGIVRKDNINFMREGRRSALGGVRDFLIKLPANMGAFICGRDHYFDNSDELEHALGISGKKYVTIKIDELTESGANEFLRRYGFDVPLPEWLPKKPLILSYLIQNGLLSEILKVDASEGYGHAWDTFVEKITCREAELEKAVMDARSLRNVMERLAFDVRSLSAGNGPITGNDLATAYFTETGQPAGDGVLAQLQRLPGLTQRDQDVGARSFVDSDLLAALQGGALARVIWGQFLRSNSVPLSAISTKAVDVAVYLLRKDGASTATVFSIAERLSRESRTQANQQLSADCLAICFAMAKEEECLLDCRGLVIESALIGMIDLEECYFKGIRFINCVIEEVLVGASLPHYEVAFRGCLISRIKGVASSSVLPDQVFDSCEFSKLDYMGTNNAVMKSDLPSPVKALLSVLRKLYRQSGAGRKLSALNRGVSNGEVLQYIRPVTSIMERHGFIRIFNQVAHPVRANANRVEGILDAPSVSTDALILEVRELS